MTRRQFASSALAAACARPAFAADPLKTLRQTHPRIVADAATFDRVRQLVKTEPLPKRWYQAVRRDAASLLKKPPSEYEIADGKRLLPVSRQVKERVQTLALVYRLEGDRSYLERAWREIEAASRFKDWNPPHFLDTAEMTYAFAVAYDWLYQEWTAAQRKTMRDAIVRLGLGPGMEVYRSGKDWPAKDNNWNQVCNGGLSMGALAIADEEPKLAATILDHAINSIPLPIKHYAPDGAGTEGATYWDYGARFNILFLATLEASLGNDFGLAAIPGFAESGIYQMYMAGANRMAFDFADCQLRRLSAPAHFWMARKFNRPEYSWFRYSELTDPARDGSVLDLLWYDPRGKDFDPARLPLDKYFREAECVSMRSSWTDPDAVALAIQGGKNNNLAGHRHLDLGSFIIDAMGERWFMDSGVDHETYLTHNNHIARPDFYRIRAEGHNTLVINPDRGPDQSLAAAARVLSFESRPERARSVLDLSEAYTGRARRVLRTCTFENRKRVTLLDQIEADSPAEVLWFAHTEADIKLDVARRRATLTRNGKRFMAELASPSDAVFEVRDAAPLPTSSNPKPQASNEGRRKLAIRLTGVRRIELAVDFFSAA
ncbi:MAG TPA: heparinase II/III family protein [Candidatus Solibacter sp.]|nr:heparinase II/III family protein [Candidatus Solibacter sp.]